LRPPYVPIPCVAHERLEFAVLKRHRLVLECRDLGRLAGIPVDVYTQHEAEWLVLRDETGQDHTLRLDDILSAEEI
jgi:transcriptional antiterminator Rof (Rho-off)